VINDNGRKNENPRDRAARFKFAIRQISIYYEMVLPCCGTKTASRHVGDATTWRGKLLRINIVWMRMRARTRRNEILESCTPSFTVDVSPDRERWSRKGKIVFILPTVVRFDLYTECIASRLLCVTLRCIVPYAFTWKCSLRAWTLNIFAKFMGGKQIDISFVENNSSRRTITSHTLWRLFKIVIYLKYQVGIFY